MSAVAGNEIVLPYTPRKAFLPFHNRQQRFSVLVCHRRAGKTVACVNELVTRAIYSRKKRPRYGYIGPLLKQSKKVAWEYLKEATFGLCEKVSESDLYVRLKHNKAEICIYGADNPDSFRGMYFDGVVIDEYADMAPYIWGSILIPALTDRRGWAVFIGTFKGKNHLYKMSERAKVSPDWFHMILKASESGLLNAEDLREARAEMDEDEYEQEFECNPLAAIKGAYFASIVNELERQGRTNISNLYQPNHPVFASADLGWRDSTAIWFWQERPDGIAIIDYEEWSQKDLKFYFEMFREKPYEYEKIWLPHDARAATLQTGRTTVEQVLDDGWPADIIPRVKKQQGIDAVRLLLRDCWFDEKCAGGLEALRSYRRLWDDKKLVFRDTPDHNWASHGADAFRGLALVAKEGRLLNELGLAAEEEEEEQATEDAKDLSLYTLDQMFKEHEIATRRQRI